MRLGIATTVATMVMVVAPLPSRADENTPKALYERGISHYNLSEWKSALEDFREAYRRKADPAFLFNIAQCYRQLGDPFDAQLEYRAYLRELPGASNREDVTRLIQAMDEAMRAQKAPPTGTKAPSDETTPAHAVADTAASADRARAARTKRLAGVGLIGAGAGLIALGGVFVGLVYNTNNAATAGGSYQPGQVTSRNTFEVLDAVSFAVGGAALVSGVVLYVLGRSPRAYAVAPVVSPSYAGAAAAVRF